MPEAERAFSGPNLSIILLSCLLGPGDTWEYPACQKCHSHMASPGEDLNSTFRCASLLVWSPFHSCQSESWRSTNGDISTWVSTGCCYPHLTSSVSPSHPFPFLCWSDLRNVSYQMSLNELWRGLLRGGCPTPPTACSELLSLIWCHLWHFSRWHCPGVSVSALSCLWDVYILLLESWLEVEDLFKSTGHPVAGTV